MRLWSASFQVNLMGTCSGQPRAHSADGGAGGLAPSSTPAPTWSKQPEPAFMDYGRLQGRVCSI